jgi:hypothetical protein
MEVAGGRTRLRLTWRVGVGWSGVVESWCWNGDDDIGPWWERDDEPVRIEEGECVPTAQW